MNHNLYGQMVSEKHAEENNVCRQIANEITKFGISDRQRLFLIHILSMELENLEYARAITSAIKEIDTGEIFLTSQQNEDS